ncbi:MAG: FecR family protein [Spirochaetota bacterium]
MKHILILMASIVTLAYAKDGVKAQASVVGGDVRYYEARESKSQPLTERTELSAGSRIVTGRDGSAELTLSDGSLLRIGPNTKIDLKTLAFSAGERRVSTKVSAGKLFASIKKMTQSTFDEVIFETPTAVAAVRGTEFGMKVNDDGSSSLFVKNGSMLFGDQMVADGMIAQAASDGTVTPPRTATAEESKDMTTVTDATSAPKGTATDGGSATPPSDGGSAPKKDDGDPLKFNMGLGIDSVSINGENWTRIHALPELNVWKFGIALDVEVFISPSGSLSAKGWDFSSTQAAVDTLLRKFYYIRFNKKENVVQGNELFFGKFGTLTGVTIGEGLIMNNYANTLGYPIDKQLGLEIALGNIGPMKFGMEGMVNNVADIAGGGPIVGTRLFFSPLAPTKAPLFDRMQIGLTFVGDINQYASKSLKDGFTVTTNITGPAYVDFTNTYHLTNNPVLSVTTTLAVDAGISDFFGIAGADLIIPIGDNLKIYGQYAANLDTRQSADGNEAQGWGLSAPGMHLFFKPFFSMRLEYRLFNGYFRGQYFDYQYDYRRANFGPGGVVVTADSLLSPQNVNGVYGTVTVGLYLIDVIVSYEHLFSSGSLNDINFEARAVLNKDLLKGIPVIKDYLGEANAYYIKRHILNYQSFFTATANVIAGAKLGIKLGGNTMFVYELQLTYRYNEAGLLIPDSKMNIGAMTVF